MIYECRINHVQAEPIGGGVSDAVVLSRVAKFVAEERRAGLHRANQRGAVIGCLLKEKRNSL